MSKVIVRPATRSDIEAFSDLDSNPTTKALCADLDGRIIALAGIALFRGRWFAFCDLTDEMRPHKMLIMRWAKRLLDEARRDGIRFIYAEVSPHEPRAGAWLASLGFELDPRSQHFLRWSAKHDV